MLLDIETYFDHSSRIYNPGEKIHCKIDIKSTFSLRCKYIMVRLCCPYKNKEIEYFRSFENANKSTIDSDSDQWNNSKKGLFLSFKIAI